MLTGIDVSYWQGNIDWQSVCQAGYRFAFAKVTEGITYLDSTFYPNVAGAHAAGMPIGAYHFFHLSLPAKAQAEFFLSKISPVKLDLPPVLDFEDNTHIGQFQAAAAVKTWLDIVEAATGRKPIIYTGFYYWRDSISDPAWANDYPLWIAQYNTDQPSIPSCWSKWAFWQYSEKGMVPGIYDSSVDLDYTTLSETELEALIQGTVDDNNEDDISERKTDHPTDLEERIASLEKEIQELSDLLHDKNYL